jgi:hypothetical protein
MKQKAALVPAFELQQWPELKAMVVALGGINTPSKLAGDYCNIDTKLVLLEDAIEEVRISVDLAMQHQCSDAVLAWQPPGIAWQS